MAVIERLRCGLRWVMLELTERVSLVWLGSSFAAGIVVFALCYYGLNSCSPTDGVLSADGASRASFSDCIYFSVVTVSSLGYGDWRPLGWSKLLAGTEVLFGLSMMGIILAKVTSNRLSYHVRRLFRSDAQRQFEKMSEGFDKLNDDLTMHLTETTRLFQRAPSSPSPQPQETTALATAFSALWQICTGNLSPQRTI
jgi:hypothetical protein